MTTMKTVLTYKKKTNSVFYGGITPDNTNYVPVSSGIKSQPALHFGNTFSVVV